MGWAIKRSDGTYRCWNANTQDDVLRPGEVWEAFASSPPITVPSPPPSALAVAIDAALTAIPSIDVRLKVVLTEWRKLIV